MSVYVDPSAAWRYSQNRKRSAEAHAREGGGLQYSSSVFESPLSGQSSHHPPSRNGADQAGPSRSPVSPTLGGSGVTYDSPGSSLPDRPASRSSRSPLVPMRARDYAIDEEAEDGQQRSGDDPFGDQLHGSRDDDNQSEASRKDHQITDFSSFSLMGRSESNTSSSPTGRARPSPPHREMTDPLRVPPASTHDAYVRRFLASVDPTDAQLQSQTNPSSPLEGSPVPDGASGAYSANGRGTRAPLMRSSSAPGVPISTTHSGLLPSPLDEQHVLHEPADGAPIFEVFNAQLGSSGMSMVKLLRTHLEDVLKMQEEVGRMHLNLEGLGALDASAQTAAAGHAGKRDQRESGKNNGKDMAEPSDAERLQAREKGVEEIMERLNSLSTTLRTYHSKGTPKLVFPAAGPVPHRKGRTQSVDPAPGQSVHVPPLRSTGTVPLSNVAARRPDLENKLSKLTLDLESPPRAVGNDRSRVFMDSPQHMTFDAAYGSRSDAQDARSGRQSTDLPPLSLRDVPSPAGSHTFTARGGKDHGLPLDHEDLSRQASMRNMASVHGGRR